MSEISSGGAGRVSDDGEEDDEDGVDEEDGPPRDILKIEAYLGDSPPFFSAEMEGFALGVLASTALIGVGDGAGGAELSSEVIDFSFGGDFASSEDILKTI